MSGRESSDPSSPRESPWARPWRPRHLYALGTIVAIPAFAWPGGRSSLLFLPSFALMVAAGVWYVTLVLGSARRARRCRAEGRWPLGEPYSADVASVRNGPNGPRELVVGEDEIRFTEDGVGAPTAWDATTYRIRNASITAIRNRASCVEIDVYDDTVKISPRSYADRQRLLWELAVRVPDAFEFAAEDAPPAVPAPPPEPVDLTHTPTGLASALAGPDRSANPPPPRNAGLGCGLFPGAAPAEDESA